MAQSGRDRPSDDSEVKPTDLTQLAECLRAGDCLAFDALVGPLRDYLLLIANEELNPQLQAKLGASDVVQQTLALAHERIGQFRGSTQAEIKAWLKQILRNCLYDAERRYIAGKQRDIHREKTFAAIAPFTDGLVDPATTPRTDALIREEAQQLAEAMAQLPDHYRQAIRLRNWDELSFGEIGERMGVSAEAARKIWFRGISQLQSILGNSAGGP